MCLRFIIYKLIKAYKRKEYGTKTYQELYDELPEEEKMQAMIGKA